MINAANPAIFANSLGRPGGGLVRATVSGGPDQAGAFTLRLDGGREVSVQIADKGVTLTAGQSVLVSPSDGKILIPDPAQPAQTQQPAQAQQSAPQTQLLVDKDVFTSGGQLGQAGQPQDGAKEAASQNHIKIVGFTVSQEKVHADGIYSINSAERILGKAAVDGEMPAGDYAAVRLSTVNGRQTVAAVSGENLRAAIEEIRAGLESPLMRSLPVELLKDIFNERGGLDLDALKALDALLRNRSLSVDPASRQQMERIGQWLRIALDNPSLAPELVDRVPLSGAKETAALLELLGRISAGAVPKGAGPGVSPELFFATEEKVVGNKFPLLPIDKSVGANVGNNVNVNSNSGVDKLPVSGIDKGVNISNSVIVNNNPAGDKLPISGIDTGVNVSNNVIVNNNPVVDKSPVSGIDKNANINTNVNINNNPAGDKPPVSGSDKSVNINTNINVNNNSAGDKSPVSGIDKSVNTNTNVNVNNNPNLNISNNATANFNYSARAELLENLCKSTFSAAPSALLDLVKQIDSSNVTGNTQLPPAEARRIVEELINRLPAQTSVKPETLHDSRQLSAQNLNAEIAAPQRSQAQTSVIPMIRSEFSGLTEAAVQTLLDSDGRKAATAVSERINALRELVGKIPTVETGVDKNVSTLDKVFVNNKAGTDTLDKSFVNNKPPITTNNAILSGIAADNPSTLDKNFVNSRPSIPANEIKANHTADNRQSVIGTDKSPAIDKSPVIDKPSVIDKSIDTGKPPVTDKSPVIDKPVAADKPPVIDKSSITDKPSVPTNEIKADTSTGKAADVQAIKDSSLKIIDNLKTAADAIMSKAAQDGKLDAGQKIGLLNIVRDAISSLDAALRPLAHEERPVPAEFYERVMSTPRHQISTETKNALFSQIGAAQESIRHAIETVEAKPTLLDKSAANVINNTPSRQSSDNKNPANIPNNIPPQLSPDNKNAANIANNVLSQLSSDNKNPTNITNNIHSQQSNDNKTAANTANIIQSQPPSDNKTAAHVANNILSQPSNDNKTATTAANNPQSQLSTDNKNSANITNNIMSQPPPPTAPANLHLQQSNISRAPDVFLQMAQRMWANTEKLRAGFQEAFSSLDLPNRVSPPDSSGGTVSQVLRQSVDALRTEILLDVSKALREIFSSVGELSEIVEQFSDKLKGAPEAERALLRAAESLERQARQSGAEVMDRLKDVLRELNRAQADASRDQGAGGRPSPADVIRSAALTAARGLESLQILSAQTRGADIQQQVFALPVKIGQEWTEVQVKFIKDRRRGEKKEGGGHVSVYLNVAPSALGEVGAHLDFHPPTSLKLSFQFAKPEATLWFRERAGELREALANAGLPGAALEFHNRRARAVKPENADAREREGAEAAEIGSGRKTGKVDFRA